MQRPNDIATWTKADSIIDCKVEVRTYTRKFVHPKWPNGKGRAELQSPMIYFENSGIEIPVRRASRGCDKNSVTMISTSDIEDDKEPKDSTFVNAHGVAIINRPADDAYSTVDYARGDRFWIYMDDSAEFADHINTASVPIVNLQTFQTGEINIDHVCWYPRYRDPDRTMWTLGGVLQKYGGSETTPLDLDCPLRLRWVSWGICQKQGLAKAFSGLVSMPWKNRIPVAEAEGLFLDRLNFMEKSLKWSSKKPSIPAEGTRCPGSLTPIGSLRIPRLPSPHITELRLSVNSPTPLSQESQDSITFTRTLPLMLRSIPKAASPGILHHEEDDQSEREIIQRLLREKRPIESGLPPWSAVHPLLINHPERYKKLFDAERQAGIITEPKAHEKCQIAPGKTDPKCFWSFSLDRANPSGADRTHHHLDPSKCETHHLPGDEHCVTAFPWPAMGNCRLQNRKINNPSDMHICCEWSPLHMEDVGWLDRVFEVNVGQNNTQTMDMSSWAQEAEKGIFELFEDEASHIDNLIN